LIIVIVLIITCFGFFTYKYYQSTKLDHKNWERFIKDFHYSIDQSISQIDYMLSDDFKNEEIGDDVRSLENNLLRDYYIIKHASDFIDSSLYYSTFLRDAPRIIYGVNSIDGETNLPPLDEDGKLSTDEKSLLRTLQRQLTQAKDKMQLNQTDKVNSDLSTKEMNKIIENHLSNNYAAMYQNAYK
ncbi:hypothetical protein, partial [Halobacillus litoralis]|uniref:hypothetical protein n=1 Tax=Halobacillus litoralis TaxID=45668 RepID=UPI001367DD4A